MICLSHSIEIQSHSVLNYYNQTESISIYTEFTEFRKYIQQMTHHQFLSFITLRLVLECLYFQAIKNMTYSSSHQQLKSDIPVYMVKINTTAFSLKKPSLIEKTQQEYLPKYWDKLHMDQKRIGPSCEDRLSQLTTNQIDRIIDMEKIRSVLNDKKRKEKEIFFQFQNSNPNKHPHIYEANFLAKINAIAIRRNIRHQTSQGFDQYVGQRARKQQAEKKLTLIPFKYKKSYSIDSSIPRKHKPHLAQDDDEKSIASFEDDLQEFQQRLEKGKRVRQSLSRRKKRKFEDSRLTSQKRWFYGMSKLNINNKSKSIPINDQEVTRFDTVDIEGDLNLIRYKTQHDTCSIDRTESKSVTRSEQGKKRHQEPLERYRLLRITKLE